MSQLPKNYLKFLAEMDVIFLIKHLAITEEVFSVLNLVKILVY